VGIQVLDNLQLKRQLEAKQKLIDDATVECVIYKLNFYNAQETEIEF
jgi:hypothetical protein